MEIDMNEFENEKMDTDKEGYGKRSKSIEELAESLFKENSPEYIYDLGCKLISLALRDSSKAISEAQIETLTRSLDSDDTWEEFELDQVRSSGLNKVPSCERCQKKFESAAREAFYLYQDGKVKALCEECFYKSGGK